MKAVLLSIKPKYCELIARGEKTIKLMKSELKPPFKCFIYCTKPKSYFRAGSGMYFSDDDLYRLPSGEVKYGSSVELMSHSPSEYSEDNFLNGTVIGEFICDKVYRLDKDSAGFYVKKNERYVYLYEDEQLRACISEEEIISYLGVKCGYAWHISDRTIYKKPKELSDFYKRLPCKHYQKNTYVSIFDHCNYAYPCERLGEFETYCQGKKITRPPQSWCYVEELPEKETYSAF